ncbi:MAG TPA: peptidylprolyl isomerase [Candidatus Krumholzibacteria bacterium]|nr:peptidylprolyl isomerase [Candidatus Krumholzibacteria bacterium]HPD71755.1 peptidylprolyl isomerase [Candidatus Krumholzibacteria bacterium]HRY41312.1 peptidylprolyl isomerase [Candidatus Krumholzibacteria bacterium]
MFKFLRSNAKFFYWIIAATFIAFIFVAWGMDVAGSRSGPQRGDTIGSVDGEKISTLAYERTVQELQAGMRRNNPDRVLTANQTAMVRDQAWDQLVREQIMLAEVRRLGLRVSDEEILRIFRETPPPEVLAAFADSTGQPDLEAYYAALGRQDVGINWPQVEAWVRQSVPRQKLAQLVTAGVTVNEMEIRELYRQQTGRGVVEYMGLALPELAASYEPDDAAVQAYYAAHAGEYRQTARGRAKVAVWDIEPSAADFAEVRALVLEIRDEIASGAKTFVEAAAIYSEDGSASNGGDLGFIDRNRMVAPFSEAAFSLPVGQLSEPVQTPFGFHLIEVLEQEFADGAVARVRARHILLRVSPGEASREDVYERAAAFRERATAENFVTLAEADTSCTLLSPQSVGEGRDLTGLQQSGAGSRFVFRAAAGDISPLYYTDEQVYVVLAEGVEPAGPQPLEAVRSQVVLALKRERQKEEASARLAPAVARVRAGEEMAAVAADLGLLHAVSDTLMATSNVPEAGYATAFNLVALEAKVGELVPEVATSRGVFALRILWQAEFDEADYAANRPQYRQALLQRKQSQALEAWFQARIAEAEIEDWRDDVLAGA